MADGKRSIVPRWWVTITLLGVGILAGVLLVGLLNASRPDFTVATGDQTPGSQPTSTASAGQIPVAAEARVNAACLRVINEAESVSGVLINVPGATQEVDLQRLDDLVRQLQPLQPRLQADLRDCRVSTSVPGQSVAPSATGTPVPSTGVTPTATTGANPTDSPSPTSGPS